MRQSVRSSAADDEPAPRPKPAVFGVRRPITLSPVELRWPDEDMLESYSDALRAGWSPDTMRPAVAGEELARIEQDAAAFVRSLVDREAAGPPIRLPDGSLAQRLPGYRKWMWDGEFCGSIGFRWQPGTSDLPSHVLGHIGYRAAQAVALARYLDNRPPDEPLPPL